MVKKMLKAIASSLYGFFVPPSLRYSHPFSILQNVFMYSTQEEMMKIAMDFAEISKVDGDYLEFGVYEGNAFVSAFHFAQSRNLKSMKFYAFDSFKGLPEIKGVDAKGFRHFSKGQFSCDANKFKKIVSRQGVDLKKVKIIPGWFYETLNKETKKKLPLKRAAVIWIDCDLYESTAPVLNFIKDYLQDGTILVFDDWFCFKGNPDKGEQKAFMEWLKKNPSIRAIEFHKFCPFGNSFIINRK